MNYESFRPIIGVIQNISQEQDCCSQRVSIMTTNGIVNMIVSSGTMVIDSIRLRPGMRIAAFYDTNLPVPLIYPPQYQAQIVTNLGRSQFIMLNYFDGNLTATDNSLSLNIGRGTRVTTINGQPFNCDLGNHVLLVWYSATTRSIPPQTNPERVVVLCD